jgi:hypothetical protein
MGRPIFEIYFNCKCGEQHGTNIFVGFMNPPTAETSAAHIYGSDPLPEKLQSFLSAPFQCGKNPKINQLPDLNAFFFGFTGESTLMVG